MRGAFGRRRRRGESILYGVMLATKKVSSRASKQGFLVGRRSRALTPHNQRPARSMVLERSEFSPEQKKPAPGPRTTMGREIAQPREVNEPGDRVSQKLAFLYDEDYA